MRKEDFFGVLGELDDSMIKGAETTAARKTNRKVLGTMAACFAVVAVLGIGMLQNGSVITPNGEGDPPGSTITTDRGPINGDGKQAINFEGRIVEVGQDAVTLDNGKTVRITADTAVTSPDGSSGQITKGDYIQGYAEDADGSEIDAQYILITTL